AHPSEVLYFRPAATAPVSAWADRKGGNHVRRRRDLRPEARKEGRGEPDLAGDLRAGGQQAGWIQRIPLADLSGRRQGHRDRALGPGYRGQRARDHRALPAIDGEVQAGPDQDTRARRVQRLTGPGQMSTDLHTRKQELARAFV